MQNQGKLLNCKSSTWTFAGALELTWSLSQRAVCCHIFSCIFHARQVLESCIGVKATLSLSGLDLLIGLTSCNCI